MNEIPHSSPWLQPEDLAAVQETLRAGQVCSWRTKDRLRDALAAHAQAACCQLFATGSLALTAAIRALNLPPGSAVGVPSFTCPDVAWAVTAAGLTPLVLDCAENGVLSTRETLEAAAQGRIAAAIAVHQFGVVDQSLERLCPVLPVIEDCSHVPPRFWLAGSVAAAGSMEGTKLLGAGEGGYLLLRPDMPGEPPTSAQGARLADPLAALALRQLERLDQNLSRRAENAARYAEAVAPRRITGAQKACWFRFVLRADGPREVAALLQRAAGHGIALRRPVMPLPLHSLLPEQAHAPMAQAHFEASVSVPVHPALAQEDLDRVVQFLGQSGELQ